MRMPWFVILDAVKKAFEKPVRPRVVDEALEQQWDLETYREQGGGVARPDAPRIDENGI